MSRKLALVGGIPRMRDEAVATTIYDNYVDVVASGASGDNQINGPVSAGTGITLPASQTYTGAELEIWLNGQRLEDVFDYNYDSSTTVSLTFDLDVGDHIRFRIDRSS